MKIPEVSLITPTCHHHHILSSSPPLSFAGDFAVSNSPVWMYKGAPFKMDASVFSEWGAQHQQTLLKKRPSWQLTAPPANYLQHHKGTFLPPYTGNWSIGSLHAKFILWYCWAFWTHWGSHLESSDNACWIFRENGIFCCCCCGGGDSVLHCLNWQQVLTAAFLAYLGGEIASSDTALTGRHDGRQRTTTPACVVLHYMKKPVWILQLGLWHGNPWLQVLPASCFSTVYGTGFFAYFLHRLHRHPPSAEYTHSSTTSEEHGSWKYLSESHASG